MSDVLDIKFLKTELLKAAARRRDQATRSARPRSLVSRPKVKSAPPIKDPTSQ